MRTPFGSRESWAFLAWAVVGALTMFGALALLTVGLFVLALAAIVVVLVVREFGLTASAAGALAGLAAPLAYVGWLNRHGPGEFCRTIPHGTSCADQWSPWPWWGVAACCLVAGTLLFEVLRRRGSR